jgi:hypothetical protein
LSQAMEMPLNAAFLKCGKIRAGLMKPVRATLLLLLYPSRLTNRAVG